MSMTAKDKAKKKKNASKVKALAERTGAIESRLTKLRRISEKLIAIEYRKPLTIGFLLFAEQEIELINSINDAVIWDFVSGYP